MGRTVLVTGVSRYLGGRFARLLSHDPAVERVIGVDVIPPPHDIGRTGFVHDAVLEDNNDLSDVDVYACGNPLMVSAAQTHFTGGHGLPDAQFFADAFVESGPSASHDLQPAAVQS